MATRWWVLGAALALAGAAAGCGDDSSPADDGGADDGRDDGGADADADADADGDADADAEVEVEPDADAETTGDGDGGGGDELAFQVTGSDTGEPLEDVQVLVQTAAGDEWLVTDAAGSVTVTDLDLAEDPPTVSFFREGYGYVTYVGVDRALPDPVDLPATADPDLIQVSGAANGLTDTQRAAVSVWDGRGMFQNAWTIEPDDDYLRQILVGTDWTAIDGQAFAADLTTGSLENWARGTVDYACAAEPCPDATLDFDLPATPPAMSHATVTLAWPTGFDAFPTPAYLPVSDNVVVLFELLGLSETDGARVGTGEAVRRSTTPAGLELDIGWVTDLGGFAAADAYATYQVSGNDAYDAFAEMRVYGVPTDGQTIDVLEPPVFSTPSSVTAGFSVSGDTAEWTLPDWASYTVLWLYSSDLQTLQWLVILPKSVTSFRFPSIPETFPSMAPAMRLGVYAQGYEGAPDSVWELFEMGETFTGHFLGNVYDVRYRAGR
ncbi:MAG: hypothetical protein HY905_09490 [Deltaproteobacteria bacterium]|nr:hypothetical protein [Deltaproteobacteria bacterium]